MGRARFDHAAARAFFVALGPERSLGKVARKFGVSDTSVRRIARRDNWEEQAADVDRQAAAKAMRAAVRTRDERTLEVLKFVDDYVTEARGQLDRGVLEVRASDIPGLVKLAELLEGGATERIDRPQVEQVLVVVLNLALRSLPEPSREGFLDSFDREVKRMLEPGVEGAG